MVRWQAGVLTGRECFGRRTARRSPTCAATRGAQRRVIQPWRPLGRRRGASFPCTNTLGSPPSVAPPHTPPPHAPSPASPDLHAWVALAPNVHKHEGQGGAEEHHIHPRCDAQQHAHAKEEAHKEVRWAPTEGAFLQGSTVAHAAREGGRGCRSERGAEVSTPSVPVRLLPLQLLEPSALAPTHRKNMWNRKSMPQFPKYRKLVTSRQTWEGWGWWEGNELRETRCTRAIQTG